MAIGDLLNRRCVVVAAVDGLFEDRGGRGDAAEAVLVDEAFELAAGDQAAPDEVEPHRLAVLPESGDRVGDRCGVRKIAHDNSPFTLMSYCSAARALQLWRDATR